MGISRSNLYRDPTPLVKASSFSVGPAERDVAYILTGSGTATLLAAPSYPGFSNYYVNAGTGMWTIGSLIRLAPGETCRIFSDGTAWRLLHAQLHVPAPSTWRWPVTPHAYDDEFWSGSMDGSWTESPTGGTYSDSFSTIPSHLKVQWQGGDGSDLVTYTKTISGVGSTHGWAAGFRFIPKSHGQLLGFGILTSDLQDGMVIAFGRDSGGTHAAQLYEVASGSRSPVEHHDISAAAMMSGAGVILSLVCASNTWIGKYQFGEVAAGNYLAPAGHAKTITAARLVLYFEQQSSSTEVHEQACDFIRKTA